MEATRRVIKAALGVVRCAGPNPGGLTEHQVERYPAWATYRAVLEARGFFEGEMRGSARYRELISMAIDRFIRSDSYSQMSEALSAPVQRVDELLREPIDSTALEQVGAQGWGCCIRCTFQACLC